MMKVTDVKTELPPVQEKGLRSWAVKVGQLWRNFRSSSRHNSTSSLSSIGALPNHDLDELELHVVRHKPEGLDALCRNTKFSKKELQIMYRGFKQECPTGIVNEETFKEIYAQFFPQGDSSYYAHYVFGTFDQDQNGTINFEEFVEGLSLLARGSLHEKLTWAFTLYDINRDGVISREEMLDIINAIYCMLGRAAEPHVDEHSAKEHVERVFQKMDLDRDGVISMDEFMASCLQDEDMINSIVMFDTVL